MSVFSTKIGFLDLISEIYLLNWFQDKVDEWDEPPNDHVYNEDVLLPEPFEQPHVLDLDFEHKRNFCSSQVASEQVNHEVEDCYGPEIHS